MKKSISILMGVVMVMGLASCGKAPKHRKDKDEKVSSWLKVEKDDDDIIIDGDEMILSIGQSNWGLVCSDDDYWMSDRYEIYGDGTIKKTVTYNLSGATVMEEQLSDDDLQTLYNFRQWCITADPFANYHEDACDGSGWSFGYYDEDGEYVSFYSGYAYGNRDLSEIQDLVTSYF